MTFYRFQHVWRSALSLTMVLAVALGPMPSALALTTISTAVTWTDPSALTDSLVITSTGSLRILSGGGINGGNFTLNLPDGGLFEIQSGGLLNLSAMSGNGNGGNLILNLLGSTGTVNIAGTIRSNGLGTGSGGLINLNGTTFNLASTGKIDAYGGGSGGKGGSVTLRNMAGVINVPSNFKITTNGLTDLTHNLIDIQGVGVNMDGILNADGILAGGGGKITLRNVGSGDVILGSTATVTANGAGTASGGTGGVIRIQSTTAGNVAVNGASIQAVGKRGQNGGSITLQSANDLTVSGGTTRLLAHSDANGVNTGSGGSVDLLAANDISISNNTGNQLINVNGATGATTFSPGQAGSGGAVTIAAGRDISVALDSPTTVLYLINADGAPGDTPGQGGTVSLSGRNLNLSNNLAQNKRPLITASGGAGRNTTTGQGGTITSDMTGTTTLSNVIMQANAGRNTSGFVGNMDGVAGTIDFESKLLFTLERTTLNANDNGSGGGGLLRLISHDGDLNTRDNTFISNFTNGTGVVYLEGNNMYIEKTQINSRGNALDSKGGTINFVTGQGGTLTNKGAVYATGSYNAGASGDGGTINVNVGHLALEDDGHFYAIGSYDALANTRGKGGIINITATNSFTTSEHTNIDSSGTPVISGGNYTANRINITAGMATLNGRIQASGRGGNDAGGNINLTTKLGNLRVNPTGVITVDGDRWEFGTNPGNGGKISLNAQAGNVIIDGVVRSRGLGSYNGGIIDILASQNILLTNAAVSTAGVAAGLTKLWAGNSISANNSTFVGETITLQANNQILATVGNTFTGLVDIYGDAGTADYVNLVNLTNTDGDLRIGRITSSGTTLSNSSAGAKLEVNNGNFQNTAVMTSQGDVTVSNSVINGTDTVRISSLNNGNVTLTNNSISSLVGKSSLTGAETTGLYIGTGTGSWTLSGNTVTGTTNIIAGNSVTSTSGSFAGSLNATGTAVNLTASSGNIVAGNIVATAGDVSVVASNGGVTFGSGTNISGTTTATVTSGAAAMNITSGTISGPDGVTLNSSGAVTVAAAANVTGQFNGTANSYTLTRTGTVNLGNLTAKSGNISATSTAGDVIAAAGKTVSATGAVTLTSNTGNVSSLANLSGSTLTLNAANGAVTASGVLTGGLAAAAKTVDVSATGNLLLRTISATAGNATFNATNNLTTTAGNAITSTGIVRLYANGGTATINSAVTAPTIWVKGLGGSGAVALNNATLTARNANGTGGNIQINATGDITFNNGDLIADDSGSGLGGVVSVGAGGALNLNSTSSIRTNGLSDNSHNIITLEGASINNSAAIQASGDSVNGGAGGKISLTSTSGAITQGGAVSAVGYVVNNTTAGNGGTVTINAATDYTQNAISLDTHSEVINNVQGLGGANWGGNISITAGNSAIFNHSSTRSSEMADLRGASYTGGTSLNGGNGGNLVINAVTSIDLNYSGSGTPIYFDLRGGTGRTGGFKGGNGGSIDFNLGTGLLNISDYNKTTNFRTTGGTGAVGATAGTAGVVRKNGALLP